jgi:hypothetical protein
MPELPTPLLGTVADRIPDPGQIRARLTELTTEANFLRCLLRLLQQRECGRRILRRRCPLTAAPASSSGGLP